MSRFITWAFFAISCCLLILSYFAPTAHAGGWGNIGKASTDMEKLACQIDRLEKHLDTYGTIVPKSPDVWGEARLTRHRQQVEQQLEGELSKFEFVLNGALARTDSSFLASATLIEAMNGQANFTAPTSADAPPASVAAVASLMPIIAEGDTANIILRKDNLLGSFATEGTKFDNNKTVTQIGLEPTIYLDQMNRYLSHLNELRRLNEGDDNADTPGYALHLVRIPVSILPGKHTKSGYGAEINCTIEPVLGDELLPKTFRDLVINDLVDLGGLPLTKVLERTNSDVLEFLGSLTYLSEEQIKQIYVIKTVKNPDDTAVKQQPNNLNPSQGEDEGKVILFEILKQNKDLFNKLSNERVSCALRSGYGCELTSEKDPILSQTDDGKNADKDRQGMQNTTNNFDELVKLVVDASGAGNIFRRDKLALSPTMLLDISIAGNLRDIARLIADHHHGLRDPINNFAGQPEIERPKLLDVQKLLRAELQTAYDFLEQPAASSLWQYGGPDLARAIRERRRFIRTLDTQEKLIDSFNATSNIYSKTPIPNAKDVKEIRYDNIQRLDPTNIEYYRYNFFKTLAEQFPQVYDTTTATLAWWILVESSLLNEQLVEDMHTFASHKNAPITDAGWMAYYGPNPPPEARAAFNTYVKCRWPIHVFALDPITQDQNISDEHRRRTEMQIVMALALGGRTGPTSPLRAQSMLRFVRRLERDMATIDVRRTVIAFSHGEDNFGWQFRPRFQSPETPSNAQVILRDSLLGGPSEERLLADEKLEPGMRECTALIVMPSFVPYARIHTRTNWFKLSHKTKKSHFLPPALSQRDPDIVDAIKLSQEITDLRELSSACLENANKYRDGEAYRLVNTIKQLDAKLPTQTHYFQVPYENTLGGFDMFNTGITDLAPRIYGFYGAPGVNQIGNSSQYLLMSQEIENARAKLVAAIATLQLDPDNATSRTAEGQARADLETAENRLAAFANSPGTTSLFIVGQNLSVHGTRVIAGGVDVTATMKLLSRQQMQVYIPPTVNVFTTNDNAEHPQRVIDLHIATPYGVSNHLLIPVNAPVPPTPPAPEVSEAVKKAIKAEVAQANSSLLNDMGMSYQWSEAYDLKALVDDEKGVQLADSTPKLIEVIREGQQVGLFKDGGVEIAFFMTELDADGKAVPNHVARIKPMFLVSAADPFNDPGNSVLRLSKENLERILAEGLKQEVFNKVPPAVQLQGFIRFRLNGAPVIKLNNLVTVKLFEKAEAKENAALGSLQSPEMTPFDKPRISFADRYKTPQQATIVPPQIVQ